MSFGVGAGTLHTTLMGSHSVFLHGTTFHCVQRERMTTTHSCVRCPRGKARAPLPRDLSSCAPLYEANAHSECAARCMCYSATAKMEINKETPLNPIIQDIKKEKLRYGSWLQWPCGTRFGTWGWGSSHQPACCCASGTTTRQA